MQLLGHTLDVVESIDTDDDLYTLESLLELSYTINDARLFEVL